MLATYKVHEETTLLEFLYLRVSDSKNNIKNYLKNKQFLVNGIPISQFNYKLVKDDVVVFSKTRYKNIVKNAESSFKLDIIYEDDDLIAINKPSGLLSIESDSEKVNTIYNYVYGYVAKKNKVDRIYLIHRLDKDTSGVIIFAKNELIRNVLTKNWNDIVSKREYIAICEGIFDRKKGKIESYLHKNEITNMMYSNNNPVNGKLAITNYKVLKENDKFSLVDVDIDTGRKNQIRVHMRDLGHPVSGDKKYKSLYDPINRLCLHASKLEFYNPINKKKYSFEAKVPNEFSKIFKI
ncbi:MAG: RluA family pseudouridine synthase [Gammaproteobacteria bacterium]|nr:RluA family pseudouridine synthase [Gammaproteobacteria bacterium]